MNCGLREYLRFEVSSQIRKDTGVRLKMAISSLQ